MARQKKPVHRVQMTEGKRNIIHQLLEEYDIQTAEDIQDALKDLLGETIKEMMEAEMDDHLGYEKSERLDNDDYRNGYKRNIDQKIISMYAKGMTTRQISETIEDIYCTKPLNLLYNISDTKHPNHDSLARQKGFEPPAFPLGVDPIRHREVTSNA